MNATFIVPLNGLAQGRTPFRWRLGKEFFADFENSEILDADITSDVSVEKSGRFIGVDCEMTGSVTVLCDRCFEDLVLPVETGFKLSVKFGPEPSEEGLLSEGDREIVCLSDMDSELDLSQTMYDYVCLSLPMQRVHEDGGCNPDAVRYLSSENQEEHEGKREVSTPFASLKSLLEKEK
jgi:Predicted metal-binding, possibly nucleic acid-binding protein